MKPTLYFLLCLLLIAPLTMAQVRRPVGAPVNSVQFNEYAPSLSANGKTMIFETDRGPSGKWELYSSVKNDKGKWQAPKPLTKVNAKGKDNDLIGGPSISYDGNTLYFFASFEGGKGDMDLYYSERVGEEWSEPRSVGDAINSEKYEGFPSISPDGRTLYFVRDNFSKRRDKEICYTIWSSTRDDKGAWGKPSQLPAPINVGCEKSPRIMADGRTLIFSSVRTGGVGSFDLYQSFQEDDGSWAEPLNLSFINTDDADQFASVSAAGDLMYYHHDGDIYTVTIPDKFRKYKLVTLDAQLLDAATQKPVVTTVTARSSNAKEKAIKATPTAEGRVSMVLRVGSKYTLLASAPDYRPLAQPLDLSAAKEADNLQKTLLLVPTKIPFQFECFDAESGKTLKGMTLKVNELESKKAVDVTAEDTRATATLALGTRYRIAANVPGYGFFARPLTP